MTPACGTLTTDKKPGKGGNENLLNQFSVQYEHGKIR